MRIYAKFGEKLRWFMAGPAAKQFGDSLLLAIEQAPKIMALIVHAKSKLSPNCFLAAVAEFFETDRSTYRTVRKACDAEQSGIIAKRRRHHLQRFEWRHGNAFDRCVNFRAE